MHDSHWEGEIEWILQVDWEGGNGSGRELGGRGWDRGQDWEKQLELEVFGSPCGNLVQLKFPRTYENDLTRIPNNGGSRAWTGYLL